MWILNSRSSKLGQDQKSYAIFEIRRRESISTAFLIYWPGRFCPLQFIFRRREKNLDFLKVQFFVYYLKQTFQWCTLILSSIHQVYFAHWKDKISVLISKSKLELHWKSDGLFAVSDLGNLYIGQCVLI